jgi:hypothetical protein
VHLRGPVAATAGVCAAVTGHALDVTGRLPFVHEAVAVRTSMSVTQVVLWLLGAAVVSAAAACTRVLVVGVPGALLVSGTPELLGRHDPGAVFEPGALLGAVVQVLLVVAVVAVAMVLQRRLEVLRHPRLIRAVDRRVSPSRPPLVPVLVDRIAAPRGPPARLC